MCCYPSVLSDNVQVLLVNGMVHVQLVTTDFLLLSDSIRHPPHYSVHTIYQKQFSKNFQASD